MGFDSPKMAPKERKSTKGSSRTPSKALKSSMPLGRKPSTTQHRRKGGEVRFTKSGTKSFDLAHETTKCINTYKNKTFGVNYIFHEPRIRA